MKSSALIRALAALRRAVSWHRRKLAIGCAVTAVAATIAATSPPAPPTATVVTAAASLPGGKRLESGDLVAVRLPVGTTPEHSFTDVAAATGRTLAGPVTAGSVLTEASVVSGRALSAAPGRVIAPVRLTDADVAALIRAGDSVDILASAGDGRPATVLATSARVVAVPGTSQGGLGPAGTQGLLLLVEVDAATATHIATAMSTDRLSIVLR